MPIYEYQCNICGYKKEIITTIKNAPKVVKCDKCIYYMYKIRSACNFVVNGYNEKNKYSKEAPK